MTTKSKTRKRLQRLNLEAQADTMAAGLLAAAKRLNAKRTTPTQEEGPAERNLRLLADQRTEGAAGPHEPCACGGDDHCEHGVGHRPTKGHKATKLVTVTPGTNGATSPAKTAKAKRQRSGAVAGAGTSGCLCGCGGLTKSRFCPGHDARVYGWLRRGEKLPVILTANPEVLAYMRGMVH